MRRTPPSRTFEWAVIGFTSFCVFLLYGLVASDHFEAQARLSQTGQSSSPWSPGQDRTQLDAFQFVKPNFVKYATPSSRLRDLFDRIGYRLDGVRRHGEVPRFFLASLPEDLALIRQPGERKVMFIKSALPLILYANEQILKDRLLILSLRGKARSGGVLEPDEGAWLMRVAADYGLSKLDFDELLRRVDIIPPSLALAQSAEESGWGTSRFAREGNAMFGQRTWRNNNNNGLVPERRDNGETFAVRAFDLLIDGVKSYTRNLNGHPAYDDFRRAREAQRKSSERLDGYGLAANLTRYSERGADYVEAIRIIIRVNGLRTFDKARLRDRLVVDPPIPNT